MTTSGDDVTQPTEPGTGARSEKAPPVARLDDFTTATRHDVAQLTAAVTALRGEVAKAMPRDEAERKAAEMATARRRAVVTMVVTIAIAIAGAISVDNYAIRRCFFRSPMTHSRFCSVFFPGYNDVVDESNIRLKQFGDLLAGIPANEARIDELDARVRCLEARGATPRLCP